jgi:predicted ribosomally synthesized peptide with nif11-like leader
VSIADAKAFFDKVDQDPALQQKLQDTQSRIVDLAKSQGFNVSADDLRQHLKQRFNVSSPPQSMKPYTLA